MNIKKADRPALILVDIQKGFQNVEYWGGQRNNPNAELRASELLQTWRNNGLPIFHVQHCSLIPTSPLHETNVGNQFNDLVAPAKGEPIIKKNVNSAFIGTDLQARLDNAKITTLIIAGLTTDHCISTTTRMAGNLGYKTFLVADATATFNKKGIGGQNYPAELIHETALASLSNEFATIATTDFIKQSIQATPISKKDIMNEAKQKLALAENKAKELFNLVEERGLIVPGKSERQLTEEIVDLAKNEFGIEKFWHKKIVRAGINTLQSYSGNPPDMVIQKDDIVILDFGPIFEGWEADLGRTYVIGNDALKLKLKKDIEAAWHEAKNWHAQQSSLTGAAYFNYLTELAKRYDWEYAGEIGGHIVGHFPHEQLGPDDLGLDIHPDNHSDILQPDKHGNSRNWILEIHFVDRVNNIGGFFEQLLN